MITPIPTRQTIVRAVTVILDLPEPHGLRRLIEGDLAAQLRRRLRGSAEVVRPR
jgi:hypothetical protein